MFSAAPQGETVARRIVIFTCLASLASSGCRGDKPSVSLVGAALQSRVSGSHSDQLRVTNVEKVDGQARTESGVQQYRMQFTARAEFLSDQFYAYTSSFGEPSKMFVTGNSGGDCPAGSTCWGGPQYAPVTKGTELKVAGVAGFEKTENGWNVVSLQFTVDPVSEVAAAKSALPEAKPEVVASSTSATHDCTSLGSDRSVTAISNGGQDTFVGDVYNKDGGPREQHLSLGGWGDHYYDYFDFFFGEVPSKPFTRALLCLFVDGLPENDPELSVGAASEPWKAETLTLANRPISVTPKRIGTLAVGWNAIDVSDFINQWIAGNGAKMNGFVLTPGANNHANGSFASAEHPDPKKRPRLVLVY